MNVTIANPIDATKQLNLNAIRENTRYGFRHVASTDDGFNTTCCYYNRTWEAYTYQSVLHGLVWKWIENQTGLKPKTKRDHDAFYALYNKATAELDDQLRYNW
ncbi:MAG: hypothetical protein EOM59_14540 [Clostridia bacterium]|nr:hypothetical protein [Clostridia bacterium]